MKNILPTIKARKYTSHGIGFKPTSIFGIPRGGLIIAVKLSHLLGVPLTLIQPLKDNNCLVVDDVADTGATLEKFKNYKTATLHYKPWSSVKPTYYVEETTDWIIYPWEITHQPYCLNCIHYEVCKIIKALDANDLIDFGFDTWNLAKLCRYFECKSDKNKE